MRFCWQHVWQFFGVCAIHKRALKPLSSILNIGEIASWGSSGHSTTLANGQCSRWVNEWVTRFDINRAQCAGTCIFGGACCKPFNASLPPSHVCVYELANLLAMTKQAGRLPVYLGQEFDLWSLRELPGCLAACSDNQSISNGCHSGKFSHEIRR